MLATFKETITSLRDPKYGSTIISKSTKPVLWYWTKYLILIALIPLVFGIIVLTRFLPEIPHIISTQLPEGTLAVKNHQISSDIKPVRWEDSGFVFVFDLQASASAIGSAENGILFTRDNIITKSSDGQYQYQDYSRVPDFSTDKYQIANWLQNNRQRLWFALMVVILILAVIIISLIWAFRVLSFFVWSLVFWAIAKYLIKKPLSYFQTFNLVIYASVLPLILSLIISLNSNNILSLLNTAIFIYFTYSWIKNLPSPESSPVPAPLPPKIKKRATRA